MLTLGYTGGAMDMQTMNAMQPEAVLNRGKRNAVDLSGQAAEVAKRVLALTLDAVITTIRFHLLEVVQRRQTDYETLIGQSVDPETLADAIIHENQPEFESIARGVVTEGGMESLTIDMGGLGRDAAKKLEAWLDSEVRGMSEKAA